MHDKPVDKMRPESNCNKAIEKPEWSPSLVLLLCVAGIVSLDVLAWVSNTFYAFIVLSLPVIPILSTIGTILGFKEWYSAKRPTTVVVTCLSLALLLVIIFVTYYLFEIAVWGYTGV